MTDATQPDAAELAGELERLAADASPGPWEVYSAPIEGAQQAKDEMCWQVDHTSPVGTALYLLNAGGKCPALTGCGPTSEANARLIAAMVTNLPTILSALRTRPPEPVAASGRVEIGADDPLYKAFRPAPETIAAIERDEQANAQGLAAIRDMMIGHVTNWPKPKKFGTAISLIDKTLHTALCRPVPAGDEVVEVIARIIDPGSWRAMDGYLEQTKRKYRGQNVGWPADQFQDKASMAKAREILAALRALGARHDNALADGGEK